jgi:hypothetical protein
LARTLLERRRSSPLIEALVHEREIWIVPLLNPDGHVYQEETLGVPGWRKNRRKIDDEVLGVDPNRNYAYLWGYDDVGSSPEPLSETYRGAWAFSEPESDAIRRLVERQDFTIAISYHSFGRLVLYPWGWTRQAVTPDHAIFAAVADSLVRENGYRPGNPWSGAIYLTNGDFDDYMYGELNAAKERRTFAFTVELNSARQGGFWPPEELIEPTCALVLPLNLCALRMAANVRGAVPPPAPLLSALQDPEDRRRIHMRWTDAEDPYNPLDHYEVFEIEYTSSAEAFDAPLPVHLQAGVHGILARGFVVPAHGELVVRLASALQPLWDFAYVEARPAGSGSWVALPGECTRTLDPTGRNTGSGVTGSFATRPVRFAAHALAGRRVDLRVRLDAYHDSPRPATLDAELDVAATLGETRRVIVPALRDTQYVHLAERSGLYAYGVTAVDRDGQGTDSNLFWFHIPAVVAVAIQDVAFTHRAGNAELVWRALSAAPLQVEAWTRALRAGERPATAAREWETGAYVRVASLTSTTSGPGALSWRLEPGARAVLLRVDDGSGAALWGPWVVTNVSATWLDAPTPHPSHGGTQLHFTLAAPASPTLEVVRVDGRRVRRLVFWGLPAGEHEFRWDGTDDGGRPAPSGLYLVRLAVNGTSQVRRLVLLR